MDVIYALWLRQIKRFARSRVRMLSSFAQPLLFLLALGFGLGPIYAKAGQGSYLDFLVPGIVAMSILFTAVLSGLEIIWDKQFGFLKEALVAPVPRTRIMLARVSGGATIALFHGAFVLAVTILMGFRPVNAWLMPVAALFMVLIALLFTAIGSAIAAKIDDLQGFPLVTNLFVTPIFFLSGALVPIPQLPKALYVGALLDPLSYGVDGLRGALSGAQHFTLMNDLAVLILGIGATIAFGAYLFARIEV